MSMTPRERVLAALAHELPDRVPFSWGFGPTPEMAAAMVSFLAEQGVDWGWLRQVTDDKVGVGPVYTGPPVPGGNKGLGIWGIKTRTAGYGLGEYEEFTDFPLAGVEEPGPLDDYPWPDPAAYDYAGFRDQVLRANPTRQKAVQCGGGNPFELYSWMTGIEEALVNLLVRPDVVRTALRHITGFLEERLRRTLQAGGDLVDIVFLADDLGSQTGLLMSRDTYREVLQPFHGALTACVREPAPHAACMLHSDGAVFDIVPDLIDAGVDVLEAVQTDAAGMDPERLKAAYGDRLSFHGAISVQHLLPHADAAAAARECRRLVDVLGAGGGYIAAPSHAV